VCYIGITLRDPDIVVILKGDADSLFRREQGALGQTNVRGRRPAASAGVKEKQISSRKSNNGIAEYVFKNDRRRINVAH
jgi:hypothetical protein